MKFRIDKERIRTFLVKIIRQNASPHRLALSFAIGTFIAILPLFGFGIILGLIVVMVFRQLNKPALMSAFVVWNPLIVVPLMAISYQIGDIFFGSAEVIKYKIELLNHLITFTRRFLVGHLIITADLSIISYLVIRFAAFLYELRKKKRQNH
ncbi:MAG: DUF2062 domain-containing protein [Sphingobacteriales bacterium]|nr:DUF2062 domain-containing protein [Sphingobacteriales bacterium]